MQFTLPEQSDWCDNMPICSYDYAPVLPVNMSRPYFSTRPQGAREKFVVWGRDYYAVGLTPCDKRCRSEHKLFLLFGRIENEATSLDLRPTLSLFDHCQCANMEEEGLITCGDVRCMQTEGRHTGGGVKHFMNGLNTDIMPYTYILKFMHTSHMRGVVNPSRSQTLSKSA